MNAIKVEPSSDSETCPASSLCYDPYIGEKQGDRNVAFHLIKNEVKVRFFLWEHKVLPHTFQFMVHYTVKPL